MGLAPVILFDGLCGLCNRTVDFVIRRDRPGRFRFASLQSPAGQKLLRRHGLAAAGLDYVVMIEGRRVATRSTAILRILLGLGPGWAMLGHLGLLLPRSWRDGAYHWIARHRYAWFGKLNACPRPRPEEQNRFLDASEVGEPTGTGTLTS